MSLRLPVLISGDSRTLTLPATNPETGAPLTIPGTAILLFSAKRSKYDPDVDSVFQKVTGAGITSVGSTITVVIVAEDTAPLLEYADLYCDVQAQDVSFGILTIWEGILPVRLGVTQEISTSVPVFTVNPPMPGSGTGDMLASVYDPNEDGKVNSAAAADAAPWDGITGKPSTFPPAGHTHPLSDLAQSGATNGQVPTWSGSEFVPQTPEAGGGGGGGDMFKSTYDPDHDGKVVAADSADSVAWVGVTGKPTTFAPSAHIHVESEIFGLVGDLAAKSGVGHTHTAAAVGADPTGTAAAAITAHEAAADPHPGYITPAELAPAIAGKADSSTLTAHTGNTSNPHAVTKAQVGLGSADNTTDLGKPISTLAQAALDLKAALSHTHPTTDITGFTAAASAAAPVQSVAGLAGAITAAALRTGLGLVVGTDIQAFDADLAAIAALTTLAFGRSLLTATDAAAARALTGAGTSSFSGAFSALTGIPTTRVGYGITDAAANGLVTASGLTMSTARLLGRTTALTGAIEELTVGSSLSLAAGSLNAIQGIRTTDTPTFAGLVTTGNVGIGAAPGVSLDVKQQIRSWGNNAALTLGDRTAATQVDAWTMYSTGGIFALYNTTNRLTIDTNGNVGIGGIDSTIRLLTKGSTTNSAAFAFAAQNSAGTNLLYARNDGFVDIPSGNLSISAGAIKTGNPSGGTAQYTKFGSYVGGAPAATGYAQIEIAGVAYKLLCAT